jgi:mRNA interferase HigB
VWVISKARLRDFWEKHPEAQTPLTAWYQVARRADWQHMMDVKHDFPSADAAGVWTIFNIGGNKFRLATEIVYRTHKVYIKAVNTHAEYDKERWK